MDGVLVDTEPIYLKMFRKFLKENNCTVDEKLLKAIAGASSKQTWKYMADMWLEEIEPDKLHKLFRMEYPDFQISYREVLYPRVEELLQYLREKGILIALASSSSDRAIRRMLRETGLEIYFSCFVSGEMFRESKPNPEIYLCVLEKLGMSAKECLAVEDSTYGIQAAKAAGIEVVAVEDNRFSYNQSNADWIVKKTFDLKKIFESV